ncbi:MAG: alkene reductase [Candidatus Kapabacteria bacterium]|nr:alkene reductase [Candidatus Kapabacteria bacterium]
MKLFENTKIGNIELNNRIVMSPMTRCRAIGNIPNELIATYYNQRADAGLIITEGVSPSPNGLGYCRIPGIFSKDQIEGWKLTTNAVHANGGKIFMQLMHTGRIGHELNLPSGAKILGPSAIQASGKMWTDQEGMKDLPVPAAMTSDELLSTKVEFIKAAKNAIEAGFDGIELHGANGYLLEQFLSPVSNQRTDEYGSSVENRCRFVIEVASEASQAIGADKVGIRLSPYGVASDMPHYPEIDETYSYLSTELNKLKLAYIHVVDHSAQGAPAVPQTIKDTIRGNFSGTIILAGGNDATKAETALQAGMGDLVAFGRPFINNPDLVNRFKNNLALATDLDFNTFYSADEKGYTDYPIFSA